MKRKICAAVAAISAASFNHQVAAEVVRIEVREQHDWAAGQTFETGSYESVSGTVWYEIDPNAADARDITDIRLAPRNARGKVEYHGPFLVIRPKQPAKANGTTLFEIANRGGDQSNRILFHADAFDLSQPGKTKDVSHAPLMDRGYTFAWAGWQSDLAADAFGLTVPRAAVNGVVRATDYVDVEDGQADAGSARLGGSCAADANELTAVLRISRSFNEPGELIPRSQWRFAKRGKGGEIVSDPCAFLLAKPVTKPSLVTITYRGDQPQVAGLGLAAVRDFAEFIRNHEIAGRSGQQTIIAYGYSQSARFLRDFLYRGFNRTAADHRAFDGVLDAGAGSGRGSFDHRYASPGDAGNSVGTPLRPVDLYPFADVPTRDTAGGKVEGLLDRPRRDGVMPKLFHILSGTEYWARAGSLMQTTTDGRAALPEAPDTRTYVFAGTNHAPRPGAAFMRKELHADYPYNDNADEFAAMPALAEAMRHWIVDGQSPPKTQRPELGSTLTGPAQLSFPKLPGIKAPKELPPVWRLDFGPEYRSRGIVSEPPKLGGRYTLLVPQVDVDGNEVGGWLGLRRSLPVGTYTAWNGVDANYASFGLISGLSGALIPFAWDEEDRAAQKDPRPSLATRYGSRGGYMRLVDKEIDRQIAAGFLLPEERQWSRDLMLINWARVDSLTFLWPRPEK